MLTAADGEFLPPVGHSGLGSTALPSVRLLGPLLNTNACACVATATVCCSDALLEEEEQQPSPQQQRQQQQQQQPQQHDQAPQAKRQHTQQAPEQQQQQQQQPQGRLPAQAMHRREPSLAMLLPGSQQQQGFALPVGGSLGFGSGGAASSTGAASSGSLGHLLQQQHIGASPGGPASLGGSAADPLLLAAK